LGRTLAFIAAWPQFLTLAWRRIEVRAQLAACACSGDPAVVSGDASAGERFSRNALVQTE
jgi:hypothetical protein